MNALIFKLTCDHKLTCCLLIFEKYFVYNVKPNISYIVDRFKGTSMACFPLKVPFLKLH